jgi:hypothetical protein
MKKAAMIIGICSFTVLAACNNDDNGKNGLARNDVYEESGNTINVNHDREDIYNRNDVGNKSENFGYVRHQKSPVLGEPTSNEHYAAIDREKVADIISKYCTDIPNVNDAATLVTDEEVLIVYDTNTKDRNLTADQVKKSAMSVVPRWYHVYVSDNTSLRTNIESYAKSDSDSRNVEFGIDKLIKEMLKSPQGQRMNNGENANGETEGATNDNEDKDDIAEGNSR